MQFLENEANEGFRAYQEYLRTNKELFPESAYEFAIADWHYDFSDHRCPHDAWVKSLTISENRSDNPDVGAGTTIELFLLGAYHDGQIRIVYENVNSYNLSLLPNHLQSNGHGDWIIDELRLSDKNWVIHEIKWWIDGNWQIECKDIKFEWLPFEK